MKARLKWWMGRRDSRAKIIATDWAIVCPPVRRGRFLLRNARPLPTTRRRWKPPKNKKPLLCPAVVRGMHARRIQREAVCPSSEPATIASELRQWPVQLRLVPVRAEYFENADLLVAADCTAYAYGAFHRDFIRGRATVIACPKLDPADAMEKFAAIFAANAVRSVTVARMEVPCCGGLERAVRQAIAASGKDIPLRVATIAIDGSLLPER